MSAISDSSPLSSPVSPLGWLAAVWGVVGFSVILLQALYRLAPYALALQQETLAFWHWPILIGWVAFMGVAEGYRGFQKAFSPRFAARAAWLKQSPGLMRGIFAPFFCMGFFGATRKRKIVAWALTSGIIVLIVIVRSLPQPWRGIIDAGVVVGLSWGLLSVWWFAIKALFLNQSTADPELGALAE